VDHVAFRGLTCKPTGAPVEAWAQVINQPPRGCGQIPGVTTVVDNAHFPGCCSRILRAKDFASSRSGVLVSNQTKSEYGAKAIARLIAICAYV
jgi:hypothetical protein